MIVIAKCAKRAVAIHLDYFVVAQSGGLKKNDREPARERTPADRHDKPPANRVVRESGV